MNDNEIKKALECCASSTGAEACNGCPFNEKDICDKEDDAPQKYALDLINRLESDKVGLINGQETLQNYIKEQQAEIERLNKEIDRLSQCVMYHDGQIVDAKAEAVKAFVKKFEKKIKNVEFTIGQTWEIKCALKQTLQEMTESVNYGSSKTVE